MTRATITSGIFTILYHPVPSSPVTVLLSFPGNFHICWVIAIQNADFQDTRLGLDGFDVSSLDTQQVFYLGMQRFVLDRDMNGTLGLVGWLVVYFLMLNDFECL